MSSSDTPKPALTWNESEEIRKLVAELVANQPEVTPPGHWRIEASLVHSPTPWSNGIVSDDLNLWLRDDAALMEMELGYRAAWRMGVETDGGASRRFIDATRNLCKTEGHTWVDASEGTRRSADRGEWTRWCPRCAHTNGPRCRCSFCSRGLTVVS